MIRRAPHTPFVLVFALLAAPPALGQDFPRLKPGQWEIAIARGGAAKGQPPVHSTMCIDEATQRAMIANGMGMTREMCTRNDFRRDGARYVGTADCRFGDSRMTSRSVMTLAGDAAYHVDVVATFEPPFMGMKDSRTAIDGKFVGACRGGLNPGDIVGPNGQKFNVRMLGTGAPLPLPRPNPTPTQPAPAKKVTP